MGSGGGIQRVIAGEIAHGDLTRSEVPSEDSTVETLPDLDLPAENKGLNKRSDMLRLMVLSKMRGSPYLTVSMEMEESGINW
ncbi:Uncharacterized protein HZ326_16322 [Fusarium oxysporum f. sp. albedinis]|nr:Uncharacterized protein HZ326_16322 [Fusarium oxysporum f. sp. albedinis]